MAVYYKFTSAKDYDSIPIEGQFISVGTLKERIFELKHLGRGTDFDLMISNPQTNEEYDDESAMIPKNTSVWIRRVPGRPRKPIVAEPDEPKVIEDKVDELPPPSTSSMLPGDSSSLKYMDYGEWDEFGSDLYAIPESVHTHPSNPVPEIPPECGTDEESKIKALVEKSALEWNRQGQDAYGGGRGFGRGMGGRMMGGRGFGRGGFERGFERKTPPVGYICHRCKVPGHFIQHCPTNGDPNYDIRKVKPPTGIPKSMLMTTSDGPYALPSGAVAVLKPNEAAFEKEIEGLPSVRQVSDLPPELRCPLCKEVMKDAVLTSKCCFRSFCDKCIRDYIITKSMCVCGATDVLADDLLPNRTLRETITRILESTTSSTENAGSLVQVQDLESARNVPPRVPSPTISAASKGEPKRTPPVEYSSDVKVSHVKGDAASEGKGVNDVNHSLDNKTPKNTDPSEATPESMSAKEPMSPESAPVPEEVHEKLLGGEQAKKKKKKKTRMPINVADMQWRGYQDFGPEGYAGMPMAPAAYNPYWNGGMPMGMDGFMQHFGGAMPYMGYAPSPLDVPFGGMLPQDPFAAQGYMMPSFPPRDLSELGMGMNQGIMPPMSRGEFEAMKADIRRKREFERLNDRANVRDRRGIGREVGSSGADGSSMKAKPRSASESFDRPDRSERSKRLEKTSMDRHNNGQSRHSPPLPPRPAKRRSTSSSADQHRQGQGPGGSSSLVTAEAAGDAVGGADKRHKASVFSRISFPGEQEDKEKEGSRKRRTPSSASMGVVANGTAEKENSGHSHRREERRSALVMSAESSEEDEDVEHHFKRRPSSSSVREDREREETRHSSRGSRDRDIDRHPERHR